MKKIKLIRVVHLVALMIPYILTVGCKEFIKVESPKGQMLTTSVFSDEVAATSAVTSLYSQFLNNGFTAYNISQYCGLSADELINYSTSQAKTDLYMNSLNPFEGYHIDIWKSCFNYIHQANSVLENIGNSTNIDQDIKDQLRGEAIFFRAFINFYLVSLFGDIPIIISTDYKVNSKADRRPVNEVFKFIIYDLESAKNLLNVHYVDANSSGVSMERVRPNKSVASALLSRCYLYTKEWEKAKAEASTLINQGEVFQLETDLNDVFIKTSREAIWQFTSAGLSSANSNTYEATNFILDNPPSALGNKSNALSPHLVDAFEKGDKRKDTWVGVYNQGTEAYYFPYKYKIQNTSEVSEYTIVFRLAEQYLIRAEAYARLGDIEESINDLNQIRVRAGLPILETDIAAVLFEKIENERFVELFSEWGHRWFDLKRTERIDAVMESVAQSKGSVWEPYKGLWPIPQTEIERNGNLTQNPGYNAVQNF